MPSIIESAIPESSCLDACRLDGAYVDCYVADIDRAVSQAEYVEAFYTSALFKIERRILSIALSKPSTDADARNLAAGQSNSFSAWHVNRRSDSELLLAFGRTRSWLKAVPAEARNGSVTRLYFGSAVVPGNNSRQGKRSLPFGFRAFLGFHKLYSRVLLHAARSKLASAQRR